MKMFQPQSDKPKTLDEEAIKVSLNAEIVRLNNELNTKKTEIEAEKKLLGQEIEEFLAQNQKTKAGLVSEIGALQNQKAELEKSADAVELKAKLADAKAKELDIQEKIDLLDGLIDENSKIGQTLEAKLVSVTRLEAQLEAKMASNDGFIERLEQSMVKANSFASSHDNLLFELSGLVSKWIKAVDQAEQHVENVKMVMSKQVTLLEDKAKELDIKQKQILSQQSALKAYDGRK